ncbi:MAG: ABC transporter permease, partial [Eubacteriales bacterium]
MLYKKMLRDLLEQKGAYLACIIVIALGLMIYSTMSMVMDNLLLSRDTFYENQNFADGFAEIELMPYSEIDKLKKLDGIAEIQGRLIKDVRVIAPNQAENVYLRLVSIDTPQEPLLNSVQLDSGIPLDNKEKNMWVDNMFFKANNLELNDEINFIAEGKKITLNVVGMGKSPEFIYTLRTSSDLFPTPDTFGIGYVPLDIMKNMFQEKDSVNNLVFTLKTGADYDSVKQQLESELKPYGLKSIYPQKDQTSHAMLAQELSGIEGTAKSMPIIFLSVAAMIMYIMLKRMIEKQRTQLGTLKAFGYTSREIMFHYVSYALIIGLLGGILGAVSGFALSIPYLNMYKDYFNMPGMDSEFSYRYFILSLALSLGFSVFAGYQGCKKILKLTPAEAMSPPAPPLGKNIFIEKLPFFWNMLTVQGKMAIRSMVRNKLRTLFLFVGIMFTFSLLAMPWTFKTLSDKMFFEQFEVIETYDIKIPFSAPLDQSKIERELARFPGVKQVEGMAEIPVTIKNNWHEKSLILTGIHTRSELYHIVDTNYNEVTLPENGILISERLASLLDAQVGTNLNIESPLFQNWEEGKLLQVVGIIPQNLGLNAYMELSSLQNFMDQGRISTAAILNIEDSKIPLLKYEYNDSKFINSIENKIILLQQMKDLMSSFTGMIFSMFIFGI